MTMSQAPIIVCGTNVPPAWENSATKTAKQSLDKPTNVSAGQSTVPPQGWNVWYSTYSILDVKSGRYLPDPCLTFYLNMPHDAPAHFSTEFGQREKRGFAGCTTLPARSPTHWTSLKVHEKACVLRNKYPLECMKIEEPFGWMDLYKHFDAQDLYEYGAYNIWNIIKSLAAENSNSLGPVPAEPKPTPFDTWINEWLLVEENRHKLETYVDGTLNDILDLLHPGDFGNGGVGQLELRGLNMLRHTLFHKRDELLLQDQHNPKAQIQNWLGNYMPLSPMEGESLI